VLETGFGSSYCRHCAVVVYGFSVGYSRPYVVIHGLEGRVLLGVEFAIDPDRFEIGHAHGSPAGRRQGVDQGHFGCGAGPVFGVEAGDEFAEAVATFGSGEDGPREVMVTQRVLR
jgi:hypothetical protein